jgi:hypothetical protein
MRYISLGTYPISRPIHGGQLRANAIHKVLRGQGWETRHIAVAPYGGYARDAEFGDLHIEMSRDFHEKMVEANRRSDVSASDFIAGCQVHRLEIAKLLDGFRPDVIALEQCWLWPVLREYIATNGARFSIVYSSQNVEQSLLAQEAEMPGENANEWNVRRAAEIELDLIAEADLVVAVSARDAAHFRKRNSNVVVAPNGTWQREKPAALDHWASRFSGLRTALFVGSGHPPNANGFLEMTAPDLGFLSPTERILVVGGVAHLIQGDKRFRRCADLNNTRIELLGVQDGGTLSALIELADVVMLPIAEGGGTNIKTAEALYNRKRIVATSFALRGYERFAHDQNVELADHPGHFQDLLAKALRGKPRHIDSTDTGQLESLLWTATLKNLPEQFAALPRRRRRLPMGRRLLRTVDGFLSALSRRLGFRKKS